MDKILLFRMRRLGGAAQESIAGFQLLLEGDMQSGTDALLLEGDMQAGTDVLLLEGTL